MKKVLCYSILIGICVLLVGCGTKQSITTSDVVDAFNEREKQYIVDNTKKIIDYSNFIKNEEYKNIDDAELNEVVKNFLNKEEGVYSRESENLSELMRVTTSIMSMSGISILKNNEDILAHVKQVNLDSEKVSELFKKKNDIYESMYMEESDYIMYIGYLANKLAE